MATPANLRRTARPFQRGTGPAPSRVSAPFRDAVVRCSLCHILPLLRRFPGLLSLVTYAVADITLGRRSGLVLADQRAWTGLRNSIRPLDILLTKSRFKLTDRLIPGYFNHAAVVLGDDPGAGDRGSWTPSEHARVVEAVRSGVRVTTLEDCVNADSVAVLRDETLQDSSRCRIVQRAIQELGKAYDSGFDFASGERQCCSKLVAGLFNHLPLGQTRVPGFVLPDDIASLSLGPSPSLTLVQLVVDGIEIDATGRRAWCAVTAAGGREPVQRGMN
jgi:hypothetical protein